MKEWHFRLEKDEPLTSGQYVCTCINKEPFEEKYYKYIRVMQYDADKKYWHDIGHKSGISHNILAWKDQDVCDQEINNEEYMELMR